MRMNILITNDDGIDSPGLWALAEALCRVGSVQVMAPDKQQSGSGTGVTMTRGGVFITEAQSRISAVQASSVNGTPADCVFLALRRQPRVHIDLLVSGINLGPNVGHDIPYSGTVMATLAGHFLHIPSMAVSLAVRDFKEEMQFDAAGRVAESLARCIEKSAMPTEAILNVNVPNILPNMIKGILVTRAIGMWYRPGNATKDAVVSGETRTTRPEEGKLEEGTDIWALNEGYVSITPLHFDVTYHELLPEISRCVQDIGCEFDKNRG
ncbi:5'/3'-nucleotidase SurE [bacterium]|nr:MAG: 5'/3'-nucleotidase SurE [bacterium]